MKETDLRKSSAFEIGPYALLMMAINVRREETANVIANSIVNHMLQEKTDFERIYDASNRICDKYIPGDEAGQICDTCAMAALGVEV